MSNVLDAATIQELLSKQKSRGDYDAQLRAFLQSGVPGIEVSLTDGIFAGKQPSNVKTGFDNARKRSTDAGPVHPGGAAVKVIAVKETAENANDGHLYLINTGVAAETPAEQ